MCVWSKRSAADLRCLPVSPWPPAGLPLTPAELPGEAADSTGRSAPTDWSSSARFVAPSKPSGRSWRDCGCQRPRTGCVDGRRGLGSGCVIGPDLSECEEDVDERGLNNHLPVALRSAASRAGRTWLQTSIPTRGRGESTARRGSRWASPGLHCSPRPLSRPLWRGKPAFFLFPPRKSASPRGSCRDVGRGVSGPPPGPCHRGSQESRGASYWSPRTWMDGLQSKLVTKWKVFNMQCSDFVYCRFFLAMHKKWIKKNEKSIQIQFYPFLTSSNMLNPQDIMYLLHFWKLNFYSTII